MENSELNSPRQKKIKSLIEINDFPYIIEFSHISMPSNTETYIQDNSDLILDKINQYGAVLLKGFGIDSELKFEKAIDKIGWLRPMSSYFMMEPGRILVDNCKYVHYTNKLFKTGGSMKFGGFHNENFYTCDVPQYLGFCCLKPSWQGGETGLVNMEKVYANLSKDIKAKLNKNTFMALSMDVVKIADKYQITVDQVKSECLKFGLSVNQNSGGDEVISIYKPVLLNHPISKTPCLLGNLSIEINGLDSALLKEFQNTYSGFKWSWHRFLWKHPMVLRHTEKKFSDLFDIISFEYKYYLAKKTVEKPPSEVIKQTLGSAFTVNEISFLAKSMRSHFSSFAWEKGDVLLIDNLKMLHVGMPGFGDRVLRVILSNPVRMNYLSDSPGCQDPIINSDQKSLSNILENINYGK